MGSFRLPQIHTYPPPSPSSHLGTSTKPHAWARGRRRYPNPSPWTIQWLLHTFILALCFPFWTFAVGGCIFLSPTTHLDTIAFSSGFVLPPPSDIARFGYWAENAIPHMCTFLAGLCFLIWWRLDLGFSVLVIVLYLFWRAWSILSWTRMYPWAKMIDKLSTWFL
jgi:hypothetical protein